MLTRDALVRWLVYERGLPDAERRVTDKDWKFSVNTQPAAYLDGDEKAFSYGAGPMSVVKSTGEVWEFGSNPAFMPVFNAKSEAEFAEALTRVPPSTPTATIPIEEPEPPASTASGTGEPAPGPWIARGDLRY